MFLSLVETVGTDQTSFVEDENGDDIECVSGIRNLTISFQALTRCQDPNDIAAYYLEKARGSLRKASYKADLQACGLAFVSMGPIIPLDARFDDRWESVAEMDIVFAAASNDLDERGTVEFIEQVEITSCINGVDGNLIAPEYQMTDQLIPEVI